MVTFRLICYQNIAKSILMRSDVVYIYSILYYFGNKVFIINTKRVGANASDNKTDLADFPGIKLPKSGDSVSPLSFR